MFGKFCQCCGLGGNVAVFGNKKNKFPVAGRHGETSKTARTAAVLREERIFNEVGACCGVGLATSKK